MSNPVRRFQNVQSKYARFNPAKANAFANAAASIGGDSPEGSISEGSSSKTPTTDVNSLIVQTLEVNNEPAGPRKNSMDRKNSSVKPGGGGVGASKQIPTVGKSPFPSRRGGTVAFPSNRIEVHKLATNFVALNKRKRQKRQKASWKEVVRNNFLQKGKIPLLLAVEAGNQSMCRELLSAQTADQLKVSTRANILFYVFHFLHLTILAPPGRKQVITKLLPSEINRKTHFGAAYYVTTCCISPHNCAVRYHHTHRVLAFAYVVLPKSKLMNVQTYIGNST